MAINFFRGFETGVLTETGVSVAISNTRGIFDTTSLPENVQVNKVYQSQSGINKSFTLESGDPMECFAPVSTYRVDCGSLFKTVKVDTFDSFKGFNLFVPVNYSGSRYWEIEEYPVILTFQDPNNPWKEKVVLLDYEEYCLNNHNIIEEVKFIIDAFTKGESDKFYTISGSEALIFIQESGRFYNRMIKWDDYDDEDCLPIGNLRHILWHFSKPEDDWYPLETESVGILSGVQLITIDNDGKPVIFRYRWHRGRIYVLRGSEFYSVTQHVQYVGENLFGDLLFAATDNTRGRKTMIKVGDADNPSVTSETLIIIDMINTGKSFRNDFRPLDADGKILHAEDIPEMHPLEPSRPRRRRRLEEVAE